MPSATFLSLRSQHLSEAIEAASHDESKAVSVLGGSALFVEWVKQGITEMNNAPTAVESGFCFFNWLVMAFLMGWHLRRLTSLWGHFSAKILNN